MAIIHMKNQHRAPPIPQIIGLEASFEVRLHTLIRALTSLEAEVSSAQARLQQLTASLDDLRQQMLALSSAPPASALPLAGRAELRLYCFGPFGVYYRGVHIPQRRCGKVAAVLKYLAAHPWQPISRDVLLEVLWPGAAPGIANNRLKVAVYHLRQAFALTVPGESESVILFQDGHYCFNPQMRVWTDVEAFRGNRRACAWNVAALWPRRLPSTSRPLSSIAATF
ncbi:MAG: hypothetical protein C4310_06970 [Chloroflexota bacterium]